MQKSKKKNLTEYHRYSVCCLKNLYIHRDKQLFELVKVLVSKVFDIETYLKKKKYRNCTEVFPPKTRKNQNVTMDKDNAPIRYSCVNIVTNKNPLVNQNVTKDCIF